MLKNGGKYLGIIILSLMLLFLITACDSGSSGDVLESETYSSSLKIGYLEEDELSALSVSAGEEVFTDLKENYQDGFVNLDLLGLEGEVDITIKHPDFDLTEEEFKISSKDDKQAKEVYIKNIIVDKTEEKRYVFSEVESDLQKTNHKFVFYPGEYNFDEDLTIDKTGVKLVSKTDEFETLINFASEKYMKIAADDITVDGFKMNIIKDKAGARYAIQINSDRKEININNCDFNGIQFQNNITEVTLDNNIIRDTIYEGIYIGENNSEIEILNNEFYDNSRDLEDLGESGFYSIAVHEGSSNVLLENNYIRDNYAMGIRLIEAEAEIKNNKIKNNEYAGIYLEQNSSATIKNNEIINNGRPGIYLGGESSAIIENNLIKSNQTYGITLDTNSKADIYYNEIVDNNNLNLLLFSEETAAETNINNNNIYYDALNKNLSLAIEDDENNYTDNKLKAKNNWWGVDNLKEAADSEYNIVNDAGDTVLEGNVDYLPFKSAKIEEAGI